MYLRMSKEGIWYLMTDLELWMWVNNLTVWLGTTEYDVATDDK